jgi:hypothetical protein
MGSAVDVPILPGIFVTFSRLGGIGGGFEWIPIPGAPFPNVRGAVTGYVSHPWIMPFSSPALDVVEWVGRRTVRPVKQRLQARWALARPGLARAGRAFLERLR